MILLGQRTGIATYTLLYSNSQLIAIITAPPCCTISYRQHTRYMRGAMSRLLHSRPGRIIWLKTYAQHQVDTSSAGRIRKNIALV